VRRAVSQNVNQLQVRGQNLAKADIREKQALQNKFGQIKEEDEDKALITQAN